jgi:hypothetical protein
MTKSRDLANAATALNAVTATELGFVDGVTSAIQTQIDTKLATATAATTYVANSLADAKGDLLTATADNTPARLAVGSNGDTLVADSSTSTGLRYTAGTVQGNPVINSAFQIWQRGTSVAIAASTGITSGFTADRWTLPTGANQACTVSRQLTSDTTNLPFIQYCARVQRNSGQTGTGTLFFGQSFESINSVPFAGKTVTFSFYARAGANYSPTSNILIMNLQTGTGTDQNFFSYTGGASPIEPSVTLTTTWQRFTATATLATNINELNLKFIWNPTGTAGANDYFEVTGVQLDVGSVALPFRTYAATIQGELAACQRYYQVFNRNGIASVGTAYSTTQVMAAIQFVQQMRVAPTVTLGTAGQTSGTFSFLVDSAGYPATTGTHSVLGTTLNGFEINASGYSASFVRGGANAIYCNGPTNLYTASAEL